MSETTPNPAPNPEQVSWTNGISDEHKGWLENKGFKDINSFADSYRNYEKLMGVPKERLLKLPEKDDAPEWQDIHKRLGRPEKAEDYELKDMTDEGFKKFTREKFLNLGLSKKQAEGISQALKEYHDKGVSAETEKAEAESIKQETDLKREWGAVFDQNVNIAARAAQAFGLDAEALDKIESALGYGKTMKFLSEVGSKIGEDAFISSSGGTKSGAMTPAAAKEKINSLIMDKEWSQKYANGGAAEKAEMDRLQALAYPTL